MNDENLKKEKALKTISSTLRFFFLILVFFLGFYFGSKYDIPDHHIMYAILFTGGLSIALSFSYDIIKDGEK